MVFFLATGMIFARNAIFDYYMEMHKFNLILGSYQNFEIFHRNLWETNPYTYFDKGWAQEINREVMIFFE